MSFETSLTGLNAASADLDVTGNNVANSSTVGFKGSRAEFADIFASGDLGVSQNAIGQGVRLANVSQQFTQGQFNFTGNTLDLAVNGTGFFRTSDSGSIQYTRNGAFQLDRDGYITDSSGRHLTGYQATDTGTISGALGDLKVNVGNVAPKATSSVGISANLKSGADVIDPAKTFASDQPDTYNFSTSTTVYDSQGRDHLATLYFRKTDAANNDWTAYVDGGDGAGASGHSLDITFDNNGNIATPANKDFTFNYAGAGSSTVNVDLSSLTQYGSDFDVKQLSQDGFAAGQFSSLGVENDGRLLARFTNGQSQTLGQIALTRFPSPQKLQQAGDTSWVETFQSGTPVTGAPGSSGLGDLQSGALEQSNVNLTEQLVKMITAQRNFQANSQMISTQSKITQNILNIG